jgi:hypothetical protein
MIVFSPFCLGVPYWDAHLFNILRLTQLDKALGLRLIPKLVKIPIFDMILLLTEGLFSPYVAVVYEKMVQPFF